MRSTRPHNLGAFYTVSVVAAHFESLGVFQCLKQGQAVSSVLVWAMLRVGEAVIKARPLLPVVCWFCIRAVWV